jgi:predicted nucleic acid-binding protein
MNYIDTDVLIHSLVNQNSSLHLRTVDLIDEMNSRNELSFSWLSIQELGFVLAKLGQSSTFINSKLEALISSAPLDYGRSEFVRAMELANITGYKNFNDCLHTAIAEKYCTALYTCNYKDFKIIQSHTSLSIHFL